MATQTQTVTQRLAPFQEDFLADIFAQADALKGSQMPYAPQQLAGFSQDQLDAVNLGRAGIGGYQPYMQAATTAAMQSGSGRYRCLSAVYASSHSSRAAVRCF